MGAAGEGGTARGEAPPNAHQRQQPRIGDRKAGQVRGGWADAPIGITGVQESARGGTPPHAH